MRIRSQIRIKRSPAPAARGVQSSSVVPRAVSLGSAVNKAVSGKMAFDPRGPGGEAQWPGGGYTAWTERATKSPGREKG